MQYSETVFYWMSVLQDVLLPCQMCRVVKTLLDNKSQRPGTSANVEHILMAPPLSTDVVRRPVTRIQCNPIQHQGLSATHSSCHCLMPKQCPSREETDDTAKKLR